MSKKYVAHHKRLYILYRQAQPSLVPETEDICLTPPHHIARSPWSAINPKFYDRSTHEDDNDSHTDSPQYAVMPDYHENIILPVNFEHITPPNK